MKANPLMAISGWEAFTHGVFAIAVTLPTPTSATAPREPPAPNGWVPCGLRMTIP